MNRTAILLGQHGIRSVIADDAFLLSIKLQCLPGPIRDLAQMHDAATKIRNFGSGSALGFASDAIEEVADVTLNTVAAAHAGSFILFRAEIHLEVTAPALRIFPTAYNDVSTIKNHFPGPASASNAVGIKKAPAGFAHQIQRNYTLPADMKDLNQV